MLATCSTYGSIRPTGDTFDWFFISESHSRDYRSAHCYAESPQRRREKHFVWRSVCQLLYLLCRHGVCKEVCAKRGEHLKSHMKNSYDCHHGVWFCGVLTEWVHLIGFSWHPSAQQERKKTCRGGTSRTERIDSKILGCVYSDTLGLIFAHIFLRFHWIQGFL